MGYYIRYFCTGKAPTLEEITAAVRKKAPEFGLSGVVAGPVPDADITWSGEVFAEIEVNMLGQDLFIEDLAEQVDMVRSARGKAKPILEVLQHTSAIVAVRVLTTSDDFRVLLDRIDPIWEWLASSHTGFLAYDNHGFYKDSKLLVRTD